jgi:Dynein heavy chain, N-terminal region 1
MMLPNVADGVTWPAVQHAYELAQAAIRGYITQLHAAWHSSVAAQTGRELECKLLVASGSGLLSCNFSKSILTLFQEVRTFLAKMAVTSMTGHAQGEVLPQR